MGLNSESKNHFCLREYELDWAGKYMYFLRWDEVVAFSMFFEGGDFTCVEGVFWGE